MNASFGQEMSKKLIKHGIATPKTIIGCSEEEIETVKSKQGVKFLPEIYRQFLLEMGHSAGGEAGLFEGEEYAYRSLLYIKNSAIEDLEMFNPETKLPEDAFVFLSHHTYQVWYFHTLSEDDNPPVFTCCEGEITKVSERLTDFFDEWIEELVMYMAEDENEDAES